MAELSRSAKVFRTNNPDTVDLIVLAWLSFGAAFLLLMPLSLSVSVADQP
mgnify:CR=1 FL=1